MATHLPDDFKCPISLEIMSDPVILSSGHTFDRASIQRWLDSGHRTCPITKLPLPDDPLIIPNHALRSLISNYTLLSSSYSANQTSAPPPPSPPPPPQQKLQAQTLIASLTSKRSSPLNSKLDSLSQLTRLTKLDHALRRQLTESGAVSAVLNCVNSSEPVLQEKALSLLLNISLDDDNKVGLVAEGAIGRVVAVLRAGSSDSCAIGCTIAVLRAGSSDSCAIGCTILTSLAVVEVNKATIGSYPNAIQSLVAVLNYGKGREVKESATALYAICSFPDNRRWAVECGAVPILVRLGGMGLERAVEVLSFLVKCKEGREEMGRIGGCLRVLVKVIKNGSQRGVQCGLFTLNSLCCYSEEICEKAKRDGVLDLSLGLIQDDNEKISRNASTLARTLTG